MLCSLHIVTTKGTQNLCFFHLSVSDEALWSFSSDRYHFINTMHSIVIEEKASQLQFAPDRGIFQMDQWGHRFKKEILPSICFMDEPS